MADQFRGKLQPTQGNLVFGMGAGLTFSNG